MKRTVRCTHLFFCKKFELCIPLLHKYHSTIYNVFHYYII